MAIDNKLTIYLKSKTARLASIIVTLFPFHDYPGVTLPECHGTILLISFFCLIFAQLFKVFPTPNSVSKLLEPPDAMRKALLFQTDVQIILNICPIFPRLLATFNYDKFIKRWSVV